MKTEKSISEPSMDEILASIRQIISTGSQDETKHGDVLDLVNPLPDENQKATNFMEGKPQKYKNDKSWEKRQVSSSERLLEESLISQEAMFETAQAFSSLHTLSQKNLKSNDGYGGQTLEDLVRESLKPLLKEWLDSNLPALVRWVVTEQVEKIIRQGNVTQHDSLSERG